MYSTAELCKVPVLGGWPTSFILQGLFGYLHCLGRNSYKAFFFSVPLSYMHNLLTKLIKYHLYNNILNIS
jgi:hypothetical protein